MKIVALLNIIFQTDDLIAINKPPGLLVHKTPMARDATEHALQLLRDQIGQRVYPVHRLDRKTSGVLLFAKSPETNTAMQHLFSEKRVEKTYLAIVRGWAPEHGKINYPLTNDRGVEQEAVTSFHKIQQVEIPIPHGKHPTSRYSLLRLTPATGRFHQIRKHLAHIHHPIIGDRPHGCNKQNRLWKERWNMTTMLLHAQSVEFEHPSSGKKVKIEAEIRGEFLRVLQMLFETQKSLETQKGAKDI